jgi:hypothetical protein
LLTAVNLRWSKADLCPVRNIDLNSAREIDILRRRQFLGE